ncbi:hypothetical protein FOZ62_001611 [Perkinsus olseni]|uniref:Uncharacterized protein n=1 Tax=Perkinsus olseni TaxID=32597 RepID=A0A7J6RRG9_PEROL|nr:hypothetical protein FOZ62_001611 [Perkinsus olseni]
MTNLVIVHESLISERDSVHITYQPAPLFSKDMTDFRNRLALNLKLITRLMDDRSSPREFILDECIHSIFGYISRPNYVFKPVTWGELVESYDFPVFSFVRGGHLMCAFYGSGGIRLISSDGLGEHRRRHRATPEVVIKLKMAYKKNSCILHEYDSASDMLILLHQEWHLTEQRTPTLDVYDLTEADRIATKPINGLPGDLRIMSMIYESSSDTLLVALGTKDRAGHVEDCTISLFRIKAASFETDPLVDPLWTTELSCQHRPLAKLGRTWSNSLQPVLAEHGSNDYDSLAFLIDETSDFVQLDTWERLAMGPEEGEVPLIYHIYLVDRGVTYFMTRGSLVAARQGQAEVVLGLGRGDGMCSVTREHDTLFVVCSHFDKYQEMNQIEAGLTPTCDTYLSVDKFKIELKY